MSGDASPRAQTTLPAVGVALVLLTLVTALSLGLADAAISGADRTPNEHRVAAATAAHLVAADGPLTGRANVLNGERLDAFDGDTLRNKTPATDGYAVDVELDGRAVATTGDADAGPTIRRLVVLERTDTVTLVPESRRVTLPRRATNATVAFTPDNSTAVRTLRVNDQVRLHNDSGLRGTFEVRLTPYETTRLQFQTAGRVTNGSVRVTYETPRTRKATLAVTVDG
jgi:hypothetical protein